MGTRKALAVGVLLVALASCLLPKYTNTDEEVGTDCSSHENYNKDCTALDGRPGRFVRNATATGLRCVAKDDSPQSGGAGGSPGDAASAGNGGTSGGGGPAGNAGSGSSCGTGGTGGGGGPGGNGASAGAGGTCGPYHGGTCDTDCNCFDPTPFCYPSWGRCVECWDNDHCKAGKPACNKLTGECETQNTGGEGGGSQLHSNRDWFTWPGWMSWMGN